MSDKPVGVIGAGSFGTAVANILARNTNVLLYTRNEDALAIMQKERISSKQKLHQNVHPMISLEDLAGSCDVIFPIVPSSGFRSMMKNLSPYLRPYHVMIHGTKGLDVSWEKFDEGKEEYRVDRNNVKTMSEVILEESVVVRVGCLAGPNLARELAAGQPAATVVASHFDEVIDQGQKLLKSDMFRVYGSEDLTGIELTGVLKNIIAIAAGALSGLGLGENARALLISRGMVEMIYLGTALGGNTKAFLGLAGVGDLVATCSTKLSRNFTVGHRLASGESLSEILGSMEEVAEGVNTVRVMKKLSDQYGVRAPITQMLFEVLFQDLKVTDALQNLMRYPFNMDIDFLN